MKKATAQNGSKSSRNGKSWPENTCGTLSPEQNSSILQAAPAPLGTATQVLAWNKTNDMIAILIFAKSA